MQGCQCAFFSPKSAISFLSANISNFLNGFVLIFNFCLLFHIFLQCMCEFWKKNVFRTCLFDQFCNFCFAHWCNECLHWTNFIIFFLRFLSHIPHAPLEWFWKLLQFDLTEIAKIGFLWSCIFGVIKKCNFIFEYKSLNF